MCSLLQGRNFVSDAIYLPEYLLRWQEELSYCI